MREILIILITLLLLGFLPFMMKAQEETRSLESFSKVKFQGNWEVVLEPGASSTVLLKAKKEEHLKEVTTEVVGQELIIKYKKEEGKKWGSVPRIEAHLTYQQLERLELDGKANLNTTTPVKSNMLELQFDGYVNGEMAMEVTQVDIEGDGFTKVEFTGMAKSKNIALDGAGKINAGGLVAKEAFVRIDGSGTVIVNAEESIKADLDGLAKLKYYGDPPKMDIEKDGLVIVSQISDDE